MNYADISYFWLCNFAENNYKNEELQKYKISTFLHCLLGILLDMYLYIWSSEIQTHN